MAEQTCTGPKKEKVSLTGLVLKPMYETMAQTARNSFKGRPNTVLYPKERLVLPDRYRGKHIFKLHEVHRLLSMRGDLPERMHVHEED